MPPSPSGVVTAAAQLAGEKHEMSLTWSALMVIGLPQVPSASVLRNPNVLTLRIV